jgi:hypothetical protein
MSKQVPARRYAILAMNTGDLRGVEHMLNRLALLLRNKVALVALGAVLVAAVSTTVVLAANGATPNLSRTSPAASPAQCASEKHDSAQTGTQTGGRDKTDDKGESQHALQGTITSIDSTNSSFVLTQCDGTTTTVEVSSKTRFGESMHGLADLKVGLFVDVEGTHQSNGTLTANSVHVEKNSSGDDHDGSDGDDDDGSSGSSTPSAHSGD